jgi:hypothetical protein
MLNVTARESAVSKSLQMKVENAVLPPTLATMLLLVKVEAVLLFPVLMVIYAPSQPTFAMVLESVPAETAVLNPANPEQFAVFQRQDAIHMLVLVILLP